jgi:hypothetical protein
MASSVLWETDFNKAVKRAQSENKPILFDFFDAG